MVTRVAVVAYNTYREAVRARVLHGLLALALATGGYALIVGAFSNRARLRVVSDLGAASISVYGVVVAIVLGATALYRELELKTIFPILARPIHRAEYLVGKYLGTALTLAVFIAADTGALLLALAQLSGQSSWLCSGIGFGSVALFALLAWRMPGLRTLLPIPFALVLLLAGAWLASGAPDDRNVLIGSALLTLCEVGVVAAIASVFAGFSSPFLSAVFTFGVFVVGRSADTLGNLPVRMFGEGVRALGQGMSKVVPNLMLYVPERPLLTGEAAGASLPSYLGLAVVHTLAWVVGLLTLSSLIFRRRDFL
jgi:ABC-type transport system involved in multi-copper enzyme maturation permease subunit